MCDRCSGPLEVSVPMIVEYRDLATEEIYNALVGPREQPIEPELVSAAFHVECYRVQVAERERWNELP